MPRAQLGSEAVDVDHRQIVYSLLGRTDVSDVAVSVNSLSPVSEPLYAVA